MKKTVKLLDYGTDPFSEMELNPQSEIVNQKSYVWGNDLSGSLQGAGGVGGLLCSITQASGLQPQAFYYCYDHNGNVEKVIRGNGQVVAEYQYDAFGNTIQESLASGLQSAAFSVRFSTKYFDAETGLAYYGYRHYSPETGRWLNRDPLNDESFLKSYLKGRPHQERKKLLRKSLEPAYLFVDNTPPNKIDSFGLFSLDCICKAVGKFGLGQADAANDLAAQARREARDFGLGGSDGGPEDAIRHCTWSCLMARDPRIRDFLGIGNFYEDCTGSSGASRSMDELNNLYGALISSQQGNCADLCHQSFLDGSLTILPDFNP